MHFFIFLSFLGLLGYVRQYKRNKSLFIGLIHIFLLCKSISCHCKFVLDSSHLKRGFTVAIHWFDKRNIGSDLWVACKVDDLGWNWTIYWPKVENLWVTIGHFYLVTLLTTFDHIWHHLITFNHFWPPLTTSEAVHFTI